MWVRAAVHRGLGAAAAAPRPRAQGIPDPGRWWWGSPPSRAFNDGEEAAEPGERQQLEELIRAEKRKWRAIKYRKIQAEFESGGAPPRTLTTEALQQIRFLKAQSPEEWSLSQLAEGFSVSEDVIRKVLRSRFVPSPARRVKQDSKAAALSPTLSPRAKQPATGLPRRSAPADSKLVADQVPLARLSQGPDALPALPQSRAREKEVGRSKPIQQRICVELADQGGVGKASARRKEATGKGRGQGSELAGTSSDEQLASAGKMDPELEEPAARGQENHIIVVQRDHEFYDQDGNFLYRINKPLDNPKPEA
ncbi:neugrin [Rhinoraja longicauda]